MKKILTISLATAFAVVGASAQVQFGFDFNGLGAADDVDGFASDNVNPLETAQSAGVSAVFNSTLRNAETVVNYTSFGGPNVNTVAAAGGVHQVFAGSGSNPASTGNSNAQSGGFGSGAGLGFQGDIASESFTIDFSFGGGPVDIDGLSFAYDIGSIGNNVAGGGFTGATNVWEVSVNGGGFASVGNSVVPGATTFQSFSLGDFASVNSLSLRYTFDASTTDLDGDGTFQGDLDQIVFDNLVFFGDGDSTATFNVVPEPSAFAAIAGVIALGFVAIRRRK